MTHTEPLTPSTAKMSMAHTITRPLPSMFAVISSAPLRQKVYTTRIDIFSAIEAKRYIHSRVDSC